LQDTANHSGGGRSIFLTGNKEIIFGKITFRIIEIVSVAKNDPDAFLCFFGRRITNF
jgi:hypothetical protein